ncbi:MAG: NUDIX hydrolase [Pseudomonadota bacterium]
MADTQSPSNSSPLAGPSVRAVPEGDDRERLTCPDCGFIAYENPKVVVGSVALYETKILLCRRAIEPRKGFWTLPAGYLELKESTEEGAIREAWEEARARLELEGVLAIYNVARISQVQVIYRARLIDPTIEPGPESLDVGLFDWDDIPWDEIAFPTVRWSLNRHRDIGNGPLGPPGANPPGETTDI